MAKVGSQKNIRTIRRRAKAVIYHRPVAIRAVVDAMHRWSQAAR